MIDKSSKDALRKLQQRIEGMNSPRFRTNMAKACGAAALKQLMDEFRYERDPYGTPWRPLAQPHWSDVRAQRNLVKAETSVKRAFRARKENRVRQERAMDRLLKAKAVAARKHKILQDTGRLRNSFHFRPMPPGFYIGTNVKHAAFHQYGTKRMPARMLIPMGARGYGLWAAAINSEAAAFMREFLRAA